MWKRFNFAPIAIVEPKGFDGILYQQAIFKEIIFEAFGETNGNDIYAEALKRAKDFSVVIVNGDEEQTFANGLSYPFIAPLKAEQLENGNALPLPADGAGFAAEWGKIKRIVRAICDRFKGTYDRAFTAFENVQFEKNGATQSSGATDGLTIVDDYYRGGTAGVSSTPTGSVRTETSAGNESITESLGGFADVWQGLGRFNDGELVKPATIVVDAIFDALFVEYTPVGDTLYFGDQKTKLWG